MAKLLYCIVDLRRAMDVQRLIDLAHKVADECDGKFTETPEMLASGRVGVLVANERAARHFQAWRPPNPHIVLRSHRSVRLLMMKEECSGAADNKHKAEEG